MKPSTVNRVWVNVTAALMVCFGVWGFGHKFVALVQLSLDREHGPDAAFAIAPVVNYLLASLGFLCLFGWAAAQGMFRDIEAPKISMLETEQQLDAKSHDDQYSDSIL